MVPNINSTSECFNRYSFIVTVAGNNDHFHRHEIEAANHVCTLYTVNGWPLQQQFECILNNNLIRSFTKKCMSLHQILWVLVSASQKKIV